MADKVTLRDAIKVLDDALLGVVLYFEKLDPSNIPELVVAYRQLQENEKKLEESFDVLKGLRIKTSYKTIPESFESAGFDTVTVKGYTYNVAVRTDASIIKENTDNAHGWLKDNGYSAIIIPNVNSKTLSSAMKGYIEEKGLNPPDDKIKIHRQPYTSVRKK
jgi:hypothetical protein